MAAEMELRCCRTGGGVTDRALADSHAGVARADNREGGYAEDRGREVTKGVVTEHVEAVGHVLGGAQRREGGGACRNAVALAVLVERGVSVMRGGAGAVPGEGGAGVRPNGADVEGNAGGAVVERPADIQRAWVAGERGGAGEE